MSEHDSNAAQRRRPRIRIALVLGAVTASLFSGLLLAPAAQAEPPGRSGPPGHSADRQYDGDRSPQRDGRRFRQCFNYKYDGVIRGDRRGARTPYTVRLSWCAKRNGQVEAFSARTESRGRADVKATASPADRGTKYRVRIEANTRGGSDRKNLILTNRGGVFPGNRGR